MYGVRLRDLTNGNLTYRELASYVQGLPPQSRTRAAVNDGVLEPTQEAVVLADIFDAISIQDWHFVSANAEENKPKPKRPKPYPRWWIDGAGSGRAKPQPAAQRVARLEDARRRKREREQAIAEGRIS